MIIETKNRNIWSTNQILLATFFAGPFGGCYLLSKNYKILGHEVYAKRSLIVGVIATAILLFLYTFIELPQNFFRLAIPLAYTMVIWEFAKKFQGTQIKELRNSGIKRNSYGKLICTSILIMLLYFISACGFNYAASVFG